MASCCVPWVDHLPLCEDRPCLLPMAVRYVSANNTALPMQQEEITRDQQPDPLVDRGGKDEDEAKEEHNDKEHGDGDYKGTEKSVDHGTQNVDQGNDDDDASKLSSVITPEEEHNSLREALSVDTEIPLEGDSLDAVEKDQPPESLSVEESQTETLEKDAAEFDIVKESPSSGPAGDNDDNAQEEGTTGDGAFVVEDPTNDGDDDSVAAALLEDSVSAVKAHCDHEGIADDGIVLNSTGSSDSVESQLLSEDQSISEMDRPLTTAQENDRLLNETDAIAVTEEEGESNETTNSNETLWDGRDNNVAVSPSSGTENAMELTKPAANQSLEDKIAEVGVPLSPGEESDAPSNVSETTLANSTSDSEDVQEDTTDDSSLDKADNDTVENQDPEEESARGGTNLEPTTDINVELSDEAAVQAVDETATTTVASFVAVEEKDNITTGNRTPEENEISRDGIDQEDTETTPEPGPQEDEIVHQDAVESDDSQLESIAGSGAQGDEQPQEAEVPPMSSSNSIVDEAAGSEEPLDNLTVSENATVLVAEDKVEEVDAPDGQNPSVASRFDVRKWTNTERALVRTKFRRSHLEKSPAFQKGKTLCPRHPITSSSYLEWGSSLVEARLSHHATEEVFDIWQARNWYASNLAGEDAEKVGDGILESASSKGLDVDGIGQSTRPKPKL
eukprot:CAMPEP_0116853560 /NCGR_PEP_ID=MMETSP0418-20121206/17989_1 /TAXON_ID=1158023 /ORGANISM="Astrosyne radiata, Strain 13vi08-1A" /LENGTH=675 /DNA_ID=CAMNT_0004485993 /DNA_START=38 /DNA_END=2065 /DNA_ORIENTATION=-